MKTFFILQFLLTAVAFSGVRNGLTKGTPAPDFALKDEQGKIHRLTDYKGKILVLYFYPKDFTPGCTAQACNLRDNYKILQDKGLVVLGISYDTPQKHQAFKTAYQLPFPLLADTTKTVAQQYGAKGAITGFLFAKRITFLIDAQGKIWHVFDQVDPQNHAQQILDFLEKNSTP